MTEIWDLVDKDGNYVGIKWKRCDHGKIPEGMYHPCVEVWVKVGDRILLAQRHPSKSEGLKYDAPGGAVVSGEDMLSAAVRELEEEVGISAPPESLERLGALPHGVGYAVSFLLRLDGLPGLKLQPSEVVGYKLVTKEELEDMFREICDNCYRRYLIYKDLI